MTRYFPEIVAAVRASLPARCGDRRRDRGRRARTAGAGLRGAAAAHPPGRQPGAAAGRADPGRVRRLRPARPGRRRLHRRAVRRARRDALDGRSGRAPSRRSTSPRRPRMPGSPRRWFSRVRGRRSRRRRRQAAGRHVPAGQAGHVQDQARAHRGLRGRRATGCTSSGPGAIGSLLLGLYDDRRHAGHRSA